MEAPEATKATKSGKKLPTLVADLLRKRGLTDPAVLDSFLFPKYSQDLADPFLMKGMDETVERILEAIEKKQKVTVYGDYDIDGIMATALTLEVLQLHGLEASSYIPDRYEEGYGLNTEALKLLRDQGTQLVISVDCGVTSVKEAEWARQHDLDLIITDHHEAPAELPKALAVINPKQAGDSYPFKELAGVGVAFALARALQARSGKPAAGQEKWLLDLVAMGTICDVMPLVGENRLLAKYGLVVLAKTRRVGLVALAQSAGIDLDQTKTYHLGFVFGPRLNAAGRLEHAGLSLDLITTKDAMAAQQMAFRLEELNHQRQLEQARIVDEAEVQAAGYSRDPVLVLADQGWSHGVVGIVASKLAEKWQKPTLVLQLIGETAKGSGRSFGGYNLIEGLRASQALFTKLGGHHHAAGFTLPVSNLDSLRQSLTAHHNSIRDSLPPKSTREAELNIDEIEAINWDLYDGLELLEPFGNSNPQPALGASGLKVIDVGFIGKDKQHIKLKLAGASGNIYDAVAFNLAEKYSNLKSGQLIDIIFFLEKNQFNDRVQLQLVILQIQ